MKTSEDPSEIVWNVYVSKATMSNVPEQFMLISPRKRRGFKNLAELIFKRKFTNELEASYSLGYAYAISMIKVWLSAYQAGLQMQEQLMRVKDDETVSYYISCANLLGCKPSEVPDTLVKQGHFTEEHVVNLRAYVPYIIRIEGLESDLAEHYSRTERIKTSAMIACKSLIELEEMGSAPKITSFRSWLKWQLGKAMNIKTSQKELIHLQAWIEDYFSERQNQANVVLLAKLR